MREDIERWDKKYADAIPHPDEPDPILAEYRNLLDGQGRALDVACGMGHNAMYLARLGYQVVAIDGSMVGLRHCRKALCQTDLPVSLVAMDLDSFAPPPEYFDLVIVVRFLDRLLIPRLKDALHAGGLLLYKSFNRNLLVERPEFNPDYLLEPGELAERFEDFRCIATNDSEAISETQTYWIGRKLSS